MTRYEPAPSPNCTRFHGALLAALRLTPAWADGWESTKLSRAMDRMFHSFTPLYNVDIDPCEENVFKLGCSLRVLSYDQYGWCRVRGSVNFARDQLVLFCAPDWKPEAFLQIAQELGEKK